MNYDLNLKFKFNKHKLANITDLLLLIFNSFEMDCNCYKSVGIYFNRKFRKKKHKKLKKDSKFTLITFKK